MLLAHPQGLHEEGFFLTLLALTLSLSSPPRMEWVTWLMSLGEKLVCRAQFLPSSPLFWEPRRLHQRFLLCSSVLGNVQGRLPCGEVVRAPLGWMRLLAPGVWSSETHCRLPSQLHFLVCAMSVIKITFWISVATLFLIKYKYLSRATETSKFSPFLL